MIDYPLADRPLLRRVLLHAHLVVVYELCLGNEVDALLHCNVDRDLAARPVLGVLFDLGVGAGD